MTAFPVVSQSSRSKEGTMRFVLMAENLGHGYDPVGIFNTVLDAFEHIQERHPTHQSGAYRWVPPDMRSPIVLDEKELPQVERSMRQRFMRGELTILSLSTGENGAKSNYRIYPCRDFSVTD